MGFLKGACRASCSAIRSSAIKTFFDRHRPVPISRRKQAKAMAKASDALATPYEELEGRLPDEPVVNVDETGRRQGWFKNRRSPPSFWRSASP